jgi:hypothetical protein
MLFRVRQRFDRQKGKMRETAEKKLATGLYFLGLEIAKLASVEAEANSPTT